MKRLLCLYKPSQDKVYPWILKHPKVKTNLAHFKSRKDAMNWFISLGYDCATWFQTEQKVFGGIFISENKENEYQFDVNVEKFDGNVLESDILEEFYVDLGTGLRSNGANQYLKTVVDFKEINDHRTYFPLDDEFVIERKKSAKDTEIEALQKENEELREKTSKIPTHIIEEKIKKEVEVKEVVKEVVKVIDNTKKEVVKFAYVRDLEFQTQFDALAVYSQKLEKIAGIINNQVITSPEELNVIKKQLTNVFELSKELNSELLDEKLQKVYKFVVKSLSDSISKLSKLVVASNEVENNPQNFVYFVKPCGENVRLAQELSYVLFDKKHVAFVSKEDYTFAIYAKEVKTQTHLFYFQDEVKNENPVVVEKEVIKEVIVEKEVQSTPAVVNTGVSQKQEEIVVTKVKDEESISDWYLFWTILLLSFAFSILIALVFLLWLGYIPTYY
ncbi:MAG3090 family protein [Mycoplasmopsis felis]|uniref:MAG3090 family protein n=1 Tax=Mycoplasmopsis felis TaxID=33923 RepID=UPI003A4E3B17